MEKKVVLITGASSGIGKSCARIFASNNYDVIINYNKNEKSATKLKEELISTYNVSVDAVKCDISVEDDVKNMVDFVLSKYGKIDSLINNAGISYDTLFFDKSVETFRKVIDVNLTGTFIVSKYVGEILKNQGYGTIINISSSNAINTYYPESVDYDASKAGVISLTHNLAKELAPNIRVNCVAPGWVDTPMNKEIDDVQKEELCKNVLLNRFASADEISKVIFFVANDATYINNSVITVDGGSLC